MRDLCAQIVDHGLRPVVTEGDEGVCEPGESSYSCELFGRGEDGYTKLETRLGTVPEGSRLLAPSCSPSNTYGFAGIFHVEEDSAIAALEDTAAGAVTGERVISSPVTWCRAGSPTTARAAAARSTSTWSITGRGSGRPAWTSPAIERVPWEESFSGQCEIGLARPW
ncbi:MAG TPA: hypothetical protein VKZ65_11920 [Glycomyces sp.]|nr:hypothetical protein [Glycomyces sp.]